MLWFLCNVYYLTTIHLGSGAATQTFFWASSNVKGCQVCLPFVFTVIVSAFPTAGSAVGDQLAKVHWSKRTTVIPLEAELFLQGLSAKTFSHINLQQVTSWCCHWHGADSKSYSCLLPSWTICWQTPGLSLALLHWSIFGVRLSGMSELCCLLWKWKNKGDLSQGRVLQRGRYTNAGIKEC